MTPIITTEELSVTFARRRLSDRLLGLSPPPEFNILDKVSLALMPGETLGLVGESGSGKTTLARTMLGLNRASEGEIRFEGRPVKTQPDFRMVRRKSAMMFQDPVASLSPRQKVGALLTEPFVIRRMAMHDRKATAKSLLAQVGLPASFVERYPHELSGGQARRVGVARALALKPSLLIADEPTAGLDVSVQGDILNLIAELKEELAFASMIVTHNLAMVRHVSDRLAIMYLGRLVETGPTQDVFDAPLHPYTASLIKSEPVPDPRRRRESLAIKGEIPSVFRRPQGCEFHTRCPVARELCRAATPSYRALSGNRTVRCHFPLENRGQEPEVLNSAFANSRGKKHDQVEYRST
ncbi:MAG: ABC transporter ATP-binding protein [Mesorhizobium sp.]|nr:ABC transporter ATP-binding protein [Mesorhizobium sp.]MBL8577590.1 ABC transporter ATP-binding protein [Mesorhizobium sp.]